MSTVDERLAAALDANGFTAAAVLARRGYYSDFKSPLATPKRDLVRFCLEGGCPDLANRIARGEFDG